MPSAPMTPPSRSEPRTPPLQESRVRAPRAGSRSSRSWPARSPRAGRGSRHAPGSRERRLLCLCNRFAGRWAAVTGRGVVEPVLVGSARRGERRAHPANSIRAAGFVPAMRRELLARTRTKPASGSQPSVPRMKGHGCRRLVTRAVRGCRGRSISGLGRQRSWGRRGSGPWRALLLPCGACDGSGSMPALWTFRPGAMRHRRRPGAGRLRALGPRRSLRRRGAGGQVVHRARRFPRRCRGSRGWRSALRRPGGR